MRGYEYPIKTIFKHANGVIWQKEDIKKYRYISEGRISPSARETYDYDHWDWSSEEWEIIEPKESLFDKLYLKLKTA